MPTPTDEVEPETLPPLGVVPETMHAQVVRPERYGDPATAFVHEFVDTPQLGTGEVLIAVMAAGSTSTTSGRPAVPRRSGRDPAATGETEDFHIGGSDASGIVYAVGEGVSGMRRRRGHRPSRVLGPGRPVDHRRT